MMAGILRLMICSKTVGGMAVVDMRLERATGVALSQGGVDGLDALVWVVVVV